MKIRADAYSLTPSSLAVGTVGSYGVPKLECSFSPEWEGLTIKASFYAGDDNYVVILNEAGEVTVPAEIMAAAGEYPFLLSGCRGTTEIRSLAGKLTVLPTLEPAITPPESPTPSEMAQIYDMLEEARDLSESAVSCISEARSAASDAEQGASAANAAANTALNAAERAYIAASRVVTVSRAQIADNGHLMITLSNGSVLDAGVSRGSAVSDVYSGSGGSKHIALGFRPALLFLTKVNAEGLAEGEQLIVSGSGYSSGGVQFVTFNADGFTVRNSGGNGWNIALTAYRYVAFADDAAILSFELSGKLGKPERFTAGNFPRFADDGQLCDGGLSPLDFAPVIRAAAAPTAIASISDAIPNAPAALTLYAPFAFSGVPSVTLPETPTVGSNPAVQVTIGTAASTYHQMGVILRGFRVPAGSVETVTVNGTPLFCDVLHPDGRLTTRVGQKIFDGSESWFASPSTPGLFYTALPAAKIAAVSPCACGHLRGLSGFDAATLAADDRICFIHHVYQRFYCKHTGCADLEEWRAFLAAQKQAGHPLTVLYMLAAPSDSQVTVDELSQIRLSGGRTALRGIGCHFSLSYPADTAKYIERRLLEVTG